MTARTVPDRPTFVTDSERDVWQRLARQLPDDCVLLTNQRISDEHKDHEADLIALMPGSGVVTIEVKGSHVWHDGESWLINRGGTTAAIDPVNQAMLADHALRRYLSADPRRPGRRLRFSHHVVLPYTDVKADFSLPECPRWQISGRADLPDVGERIWDTTSLHAADAAIPDAHDVATIEAILCGRNLPDRDVRALAGDRRRLSDHLTEEQATLLSVTRLIPRVEVRGGAGSGKTVMAVRQARDLASGRYGKAERIAVLCYSYGLAAHLRKSLLTGPRKKQPAFVGTFEDLGRSWGIEAAGRDDSDFWERRLPEEMAEAALGLTDGKKFDAVIVDEAQDFAENWWTPILRALRDEEAGGLYVYSDEQQRVFPRYGRPPVRLVPLVLDHNLRNTRQIARCFEPLAPTGLSARGGEGPEVEFIPAAGDDAIGSADDAVEALFADGWQAGDIALLTTGRRHPVQKERQDELGARDYWETLDEDDVFYGHVLGFKGLERRVVVLCVNESSVSERAAERLYVGMSRATDLLVVVGDPRLIASAGGAEVAERLGIGV
ncbi:nuclease-related domain-containing DEAD/DEAH box helicase [Acidipropionibacterium virtanenii]|uniref:NERD domain-containing protein n=1 Tax=Acidipropionibacterium virtanenii TaxID=2057246 RepID=A0A344UR46_9ACTN|nr:NERD domain-containing protein [Acidipropionibacterium virtanenii]AXE37744.1 hypothetical protein JS278_00551 [Acidipropionibacterium virtanenii]